MPLPQSPWQRRLAAQHAARRAAPADLFNAWHPRAAEQLAALDRLVVRVDPRDMGQTAQQVAEERAAIACAVAAGHELAEAMQDEP